jgi:hypothetical protein
LANKKIPVQAAEHYKKHKQKYYDQDQNPYRGTESPSHSLSLAEVLKIIMRHDERADDD